MPACRATNAVLLLALIGTTAGCAGDSQPVDVVLSSAATDTIRPEEDGYYRSAVTAIDERDYARALDFLQAARQKRPDSVPVLNAFGVVYDKLGRFDLSARYYAQARALEPNSPLIKANMAYSAALQGVDGDKVRVAGEASPGIETVTETGSEAPPLAPERRIAAADFAPGNARVSAEAPALPEAPPAREAALSQPPIAAPSVAVERHILVSTVQDEAPSPVRAPAHPVTAPSLAVERHILASAVEDETPSPVRAPAHPIGAAALAPAVITVAAAAPVLPEPIMPAAPPALVVPIAAQMVDIAPLYAPSAPPPMREPKILPPAPTVLAPAPTVLPPARTVLAPPPAVLAPTPAVLAPAPAVPAPTATAARKKAPAHAPRPQIRTAPKPEPGRWDLERFLAAASRPLLGIASYLPRLVSALEWGPRSAIAAVKTVSLEKHE